MNETNYLYGFEPEDSNLTVEYPETNKTVVFDCFCGSVDAIESETYRKDGLAGIGYAPLSYGATRTLQLVSDFDDFVNDSEFKIGLYTVGKLEMENFWRVIRQNKGFRVLNYAITDGKSGIYEIGKGKSVFGFLLNNMTFDGQNSYFLFCLKEKQTEHGVISTKTTAKKLFIQKGRYPTVKTLNNGKMNRWGRVLNELESVGATAINAWSVLESEDSRFFYAELKKHNVFTKSDKQLLKSIRKYGFTRSFDCILEDIEEEMEELETKMEDLEETVAYGEVFSDFKFIRNAKFELRAVENEYEEIRTKWLELTEENNSETVDTTIDDYYVPVDLMEKYN